MSYDSNNDYDVIVAGAGIAGSLAAMSAAKNGARVLLLDRNDETQPGKKTNWGWVCGNTVAKSHLAFLHKELGLTLSEPELEPRSRGSTRSARTSRTSSRSRARASCSTGLSSRGSSSARR